MKKSKLLLFFGMATIIISISSFISMDSITPIHAITIAEIQEKRLETMWYLGKGIQEGDQYTFSICDNQYFADQEYCYSVKLIFVGLYDSPYGKQWIVSSQLNDGEQVINSVMRISDIDFKIRTDPESANIAKSFENTIFSIGKYANEQNPQSLKLGKTWDVIDSYYGNENVMVRDVFDDSHNYIISETFGLKAQKYQVGYSVGEISEFSINQGLPFPTSANIYSPTQIIPEPKKLFEFKLQEFEPGLQNAIEVTEVKEICLDEEISKEGVHNPNEILENYQNIPDHHLNEEGLMIKHSMKDGLAEFSEDSYILEEIQEPLESILNEIENLPNFDLINETNINIMINSTVSAIKNLTENNSTK